MVNRYRFEPAGRPGACLCMVDGQPLVRVGDEFECEADDPIIERLNAAYRGVKPRGGERRPCCVLVASVAPPAVVEPEPELSAVERINLLATERGGGAALSGVANAVDVSASGAKATIAARIIAWMGDDEERASQVIAILDE